MFYYSFFLLSKLALSIFFNKVNYVLPKKKKKRYTFMSFTHYSCPFLLSFQFLLGSAVSPFLFAFFFAECLSSFLDHLDSFLSNVGKLKGEVGQYIGASTCK